MPVGQRESKGGGELMGSEGLCEKSYDKILRVYDVSEYVRGCSKGVADGMLLTCVHPTFGIFRIGI